LQDENYRHHFTKGIDLNMNARKILHSGLYRELFV